MSVSTTTFSDTYYVDTMLSDANTLRAFSDDFDTWLTSSARPWSSVATIRATLTSSSSGRVAVRITSTGDSVAMTPNTTAVAMSGLSSFTSTTDTTGSGVLGTFDPAQISFRQWLSWNKSPGVVSGGGAFVTGYPAANLRRPSLQMLMTERDVVAMSSAFAVASNPRRADIYQRTLRTWRRVAVGPLRTPRRAGDLYRGGLEVVG